MMEKVRDTCAIVQAPTESEHVLFVLVRPPNKGGIPALSVQQKLAASLSARFVASDDVLLQAGSNDVPYIAENGKDGRAYIVLKATVAAAKSDEVAAQMRDWPEVVGLHRKLAVESMLFQAFADVYDMSGPKPILVGEHSRAEASSTPTPAISMEGLEYLVARLDLDLEPAQLRVAFLAHSDSSAPGVSWHSVALQVARCLRPHRQRLQDALEVLDASAVAAAERAGQKRAPGTVGARELKSTLVHLRKSLGLEAHHVDAIVKRARIFSPEGKGGIAYKEMLNSICASLEAWAAPTAEVILKRQETARNLGAQRSREVARQIEAEWRSLKSLAAKDKEAGDTKARLDKLAKDDHERFLREKKDEILTKGHKKKPGEEMSWILTEILTRGRKNRLGCVLFAFMYAYTHPPNHKHTHTHTH